ncbi:MAG TPA: hypothetical protein VME17_14290 [Bryobacteraceae bacterium]|nr:hypothetical protein [Bryobacteraceae bacterium]
MKAALFSIVLFSGMLTSVSAWTQIREQTDSNREHVQWVAESLKSMLSVKPGMTRGDLLRVFTTEGGVFTGLHRTYVFRECPYFKIDVDFEAVGRPARDPEGRVTLTESEADTIKTISRPYLQFSASD